MGERHTPVGVPGKAPTHYLERAFVFPPLIVSLFFYSSHILFVLRGSASVLLDIHFIHELGRSGRNVSCSCAQVSRASVHTMQTSLGTELAPGVVWARRSSGPSWTCSEDAPFLLQLSTMKGCRRHAAVVGAVARWCVDTTTSHADTAFLCPNRSEALAAGGGYVSESGLPSSG